MQLIIILILIFISYATLLQSLNIQAQCMEKSFVFKINSNKTQINNKNQIKLFYSISISNEIHVSNQSDYFAKCLKSVVFKLRPSSQSSTADSLITLERENNFVLNDNETNQTESSITFSNLTHLSLYSLDVSLKQSVQYSACPVPVEIEKIKNHPLYTCLERPHLPTILFNPSNQSWHFDRNTSEKKISPCYYHRVNQIDLTNQTLKLTSFNLTNSNETFFLYLNNQTSGVFYMLTVSYLTCFTNDTIFNEKCAKRTWSKNYYKLSYSSTLSQEIAFKYEVGVLNDEHEFNNDDLEATLDKLMQAELSSLTTSTSTSSTKKLNILNDSTSIRIKLRNQIFKLSFFYLLFFRLTFIL